MIGLGSSYIICPRSSPFGNSSVRSTTYRLSVCHSSHSGQSKASRLQKLEEGKSVTMVGTSLWLKLILRRDHNGRTLRIGDGCGENENNYGYRGLSVIECFWSQD